MIIRRLSLKNYRKFQSMDVEFPTGLIGVVGKNGMGKTTILEAVAFALYGAAASRTKAKGVRRDSCSPEEACEVELEFSFNGTPFRIVRRARGPRESWQAEVFEGTNPEPSATGQKGVENLIRQRLGMDYQMFTRSVFSKQKEVNALSDSRPDERRGAIRRMVGIETITKARELARKDLRDKEKEIEGARRAMEALPKKQAEESHIQKQIRPARTALGKAQKKAAGAARRLRTATARFDKLERKRDSDAAMAEKMSSLEASLQAWRKDKERIKEEINRIDMLKKELQNLAPQTSNFRNIQRKKEKLDRNSGKYEERVELEDEIDGKKKKLAVVEKRVGRLDKRCKALVNAPKKLQAARTKRRKAKGDLERLQRELTALSKKQGGMKSKLERVKNAIAEIRDQGSSGKCPTCYRELGESYKEILTHLTAEKTAARTELHEAEATVKEIKVKIQSARRLVSSLESTVDKAAEDAHEGKSIKAQLADARKELTSMRQEIKRKEKRRQALARVDYDPQIHEEIQVEYQRLERMHKRVEALREKVSRRPELSRQLGAGTKKISSIKRQISLTKKKRATLGFDSRKHKNAKATLNATRDEDKNLALAVKEAEAEVDKLQDRLRIVRDDIMHLNQLRERIAGDEEEVRYLRRIDSLLDDFRNDLIRRVKPQIEEHASFLLDQVTDGRYPRVSLDDDYNISLNDGMGTYPLKRFSGGEEDLANLCLRLAIAQVVAQRASGRAPSVVVLDEVFAAQDVERREKLLQALSRLQEIFQQIVLITHMEDIHDRVPHLLRVTENSVKEAEAAWA